MKKIITLIISVIFALSIYAQTSQNINLPEGYGSMTADIDTGNSYIFAYTPDGINIFNATDNSFKQKIEFNSTGAVYGKFNPVFFDSRLMVRDQSLMAYCDETNHKYLYVLTPSLKLLIINTSNLSQTWTVSLKISKTGEEYLDNILDSQNGRAILKYDESNKRLFLLVGGKDKNANCTGNFHIRTNIFAFYDVDYTVNPDNQGFLNLHFVREKTPDDEYGEQINNYAFFTKNNNHYFTVVRLGKRGLFNNGTALGYIDTYKITEIDADSIENDHIDIPSPGDDSYYKMGKLLIIPEIDKIVSLPYKYFVSDCQNPVFCVMDYSNPENVSHQIINSPSRKILSAVYLNQNDDLIVGYEPDNNDIRQEYQNTNLAVYHYNDNTDLFDLTPSFTFGSDNSQNTSPFDFNSSVYLTKINNSTALISRKDGIGKIEFDENDYIITDNILDWNAENNFFGKGVIDSNKVFICNHVANGIEIYNINNNNFENSIRTGYPVYKAEANGDGSIILFYNTLNVYNAGLYAYSTETGTVTHINPNGTFTAAIGDCKYNSFSNEFVITEFRPDDAKIIRLNADNLTKAGEKEFMTKKFSKELFISPEGYLYVVAINGNQPNKPQVIVLNATDYSDLETIDVDDFSTYNLPFAYYSADFSYNPYDKTIDVILTVQEKKLLPYNSITSNIYGEEITNSVPPSKMIVISDEHTRNSDYNFDNYAVKIICPYSISQNKSSQYYGKSFVIGEKFYMVDYLNNNSVAGFNEHPFINIVYDTLNDIIFALKERYYINESDTCGEHRQFEIWKITMTDNFPFVHFEKFNGDGLLTDGQVAGMFYNTYDARIYVYKKTDAEKLGTVQESLMSFSYDNPTWQIVELGNKTYFPDYDHTRDDSYFFMNNDVTPYIDPYNNKIYLPNGGHSNVSVVDFVANEQLTLHNNNSGGKSITWLSIPRHLRNNPDGTTNTQVVFAENNFSNGYNTLYLEYDNIDPNSHANNLVHAEGDNNNNWTWNNSIMETINSIRGYKLEIGPNGPNKLTITGTLENQNTGITLLGPINDNWPENWVGYWLYQEQSPFDAIEPNQLDDLAIIKAQDWYCYRDETPAGSGQAPWICALNIGINAPRLKYGDMVILKSYNDINGFHWQNGTTPSPSEVKSATVHYQYEEQADYTAYLIEIDTSNRPQEIGAFIGDSCIGATTVLPDDTLVLIRGYDKDTVGDVAFEEYYGTKSSVPAITDYFVKIPGKQLWQKRTINAAEKKGHYLISFKRKKTVSPVNDDNDFALKVYPNPAQNSLTVEYTTSGDANTTLEVLDVTGKKIVNLQNRLTAGMHQNIINTQSFKNGIYLLRVSTGSKNAVKRFVVNK